MKYFLNKIIIILIISVFLISSCHKKNKPPETPYTPSGPHIALINVTYQFGSLAFDPNGDSIAIRFDWGNEDTSDWKGWYASGEEIWLPNSWSSYGTYYVRAQAKDKKESTSEWSLPHYVNVTQNRPPNTPSITGPLNGYILIPYTFTGSTADPDYDSIALRFAWGDDDTSEWSEWIASDDLVQKRHSWSNEGTCYIKTQAKDKNELFSNWSLPHPIQINSEVPEMIWILGGYSSPHDVWCSEDGVNWICVNESAPWGPNCHHTSVVFDDKIWVIGGLQGNEVWYSSDGFNWTCATQSAQWLPRINHTSVVFDNKIWVIGGFYYSSWFNDVWYSTDGINWNCAKQSAPWLSRELHTSVVFDNKIWVLGGERYPSTAIWDDVWYSDNGRDWYCATDSAEWGPRLGHTSVVFDNKIWVLAGMTPYGYGHGPSDDVWCSTNGSYWICMTDSADWQKREYHTSVVFKNKIWVLGGYVGGWTSKGNMNDVWYSSNGVDWTCATPSAPWHPRDLHTSVVFKIGGPNK
jgi:hypothetical protein